jgi:hypothetical protein
MLLQEIVLLDFIAKEMPQSQLRPTDRQVCLLKLCYMTSQGNITFNAHYICPPPPPPPPQPTDVHEIHVDGVFILCQDSLWPSSH